MSWSSTATDHPSRSTRRAVTRHAARRLAPRAAAALLSSMAAGMNMLARLGSRGHPVLTSPPLPREAARRASERSQARCRCCSPRRRRLGAPRLHLRIRARLQRAHDVRALRPGLPALVRVSGGRGRLTLHTELWNQFGHLLEAPQTSLIDDALRALHLGRRDHRPATALVKGPRGPHRGPRIRR
jgi:hypothetical protein